MNEDQDYAYEVVTKYEDSTRCFNSLLMAIDYFDSLNEEATIWDFTCHENGELIKTKY